MDMLKRMYELQQAYNGYMEQARGLTDVGAGEWQQKYVLAMISELSELLDEVNFKWWKNARPIDEDKLKDELVDVLHFYLAMCIKAGMSPEEMYERYCAKNAENFARQRGTSEKKGYEVTT